MTTYYDAVIVPSDARRIKRAMLETLKQANKMRNRLAAKALAEAA